MRNKERSFPAPLSFINSNEVFIIAEIGGNHEGDFNYAKKLLNEAIDSGAHAIKFQIYQGDKIVSKVEGPDRNKHFKKFELGYEQYKTLAKLAKDAGMHFMASLWDSDAIETFDPLIDIHKVGSGDFTNFPLLKKLANTNKPLILATAMCNLDDIRQTLNFIDSINPNLRKENKLCLMHCVAMYGDPKDEYAHLAAIKVLQEEFSDIHIGYSDHTLGNYACELAIAMGSRVIEVHFTDDKTREFRDHHLSITKDEMRDLLEKSKKIISLLGDFKKEPVQEIETKERIADFRRAVYLTKDVVAGTKITEEMLTTLRPNKGIDARSFYNLIGKKLIRDVNAYEALSINWIENDE
ncbi:MAG: N-acetylneuraminate synthase family protein [Bdellovibrionales bacterium]|nr:N-acetylneuraminate synthase family protein [Bdellovibrionales bacterium]